MDGETQQTPAQNAGSNDIKDIMGGMSESAKPESKPDGNKGAAEQGNSTGDNGKGSEVQHPAWMSQINSELISDADKAGKLSKFEKLSDLASAYLEAEGKLGSSIVKPGENASDEERRAFYKALGVPDAADKYSIEGDEAKMFREMAFNNNLTDEQAKSLYASLQKVRANAAEAQKQAFAQQVHDTQSALQKEYGNDYQTKIEMLKRGVATYGGAKIGAKLERAGLLGDYDVVKMFIQLGEQSAEAGSPGTTKGKTDGYKSIEEGGTFSFFTKK